MHILHGPHPTKSYHTAPHHTTHIPQHKQQNTKDSKFPNNQNSGPVYPNPKTDIDKPAGMRQFKKLLKTKSSWSPTSCSVLCKSPEFPTLS